MRLWDAGTDKPLTEKLCPSHQPIRALAFRPDGRTVLTGDDDHDATFWDRATGQRIATFVHKGQVRGVAFSPTAKRC